MLSMTWDQLFLDYLPPQVLPANPLFVRGSRAGSEVGCDFWENELEGGTQAMRRSWVFMTSSELREPGDELEAAATTRY